MAKRRLCERDMLYFTLVDSLIVRIFIAAKYKIISEEMR